MKIKIKASSITDEFKVCPYCMDGPKHVDRAYTGCCGESSSHYEQAYEVGEELYLESQIIIEEDSHES